MTDILNRGSARPTRLVLAGSPSSSVTRLRSIHMFTMNGPPEIR